MEPLPRQYPKSHAPLQPVAREVCPGAEPQLPAGHCVQDVAPDAEEKDPAGQAAQVEPLRKNPALHDAVPTKAAPPAVRDQKEPAVGVLAMPAAKQMLARPSAAPSNLLPAYEKVIADAVVESGMVRVGAVQLKQPDRAGVTGPAGHTPKKPPKKSADDDASALIVMEIALYAVDDDEAGAQNMM